MGEEVYGDVEAGETYVVAFSNVRRNFRFRELHEVDPEGFRVLNLLGGGPALFEDTAGVRLLFANRDTEKPPAPKALLAAAVATLSSDDPRTRAFAALELRHRPEWLALMSSADARAVRATIADTGVAPEVRHYLLETARELPAGLTGSWLVKEGRSILRSVDPQLDLTSSFPLLAINAIGVVEEGGGKADGAVVSPFLGSNNPGVVKAALKALDRLDPALARQRAGKVLERGGLHAESRRVLGEYLEPAQR